MGYYYIVLFLNFILFSTITYAALPESIDSYFRKIYPPPNQISIEIKTAKKHWPSCEKPQITSPINNRTMGNLSLLVQCDEQKKFIQLFVHVTGFYYIASRHISCGEEVYLTDFTLKKGKLNALPNNIVTNKTLLQNSITLQKIDSGQVLTQAMIRKPWTIKAGQSVYVLISDEHIFIKNIGQATNNAKIGENVRVRLVNGHIIHGKALDNRNVKIELP